MPATKVRLLCEEPGASTADKILSVGSSRYTTSSPKDTVRNFNGKIDEFRIYNRVLSESEIKQLYAGDTCSISNSGSVSHTLDIHMPSLSYESLTGTQNIWADFEFYGQDANGELLWKLRDFGINQ